MLGAIWQRPALFKRALRRMTCGLEKFPSRAPRPTGLWRQLANQMAGNRPPPSPAASSDVE